MRVLGVDPGLTRCGFGVVDGAGGAGRLHVGAEQGGLAYELRHEALSVA